MLGTLIESRARRQPRAGGAALSVAAHLAIAGAVGALSMHRVGGPLVRPKPDVIHFHLDPRPAPAVRQATSATGSRASSWVAAPLMPRLVMSNLVPNVLPPITLAAAPPPADVAFAPTSGNAGDGGPRGIIDGAGGDASAPWTGRELLMRLAATSTPHYPETLRQSGVEGSVLVRFVVDTAGRIEPSSVRVLASTHPLFTRAVLDALGGFRFRPAEGGGRKVEAEAEMPFEFSLSRTR